MRRNKNHQETNRLQIPNMHYRIASASHAYMTTESPVCCIGFYFILNFK